MPVTTVDDMDLVAWVSFGASLAQIVDYAAQATRPLRDGNSSAEAWRRMVERAAQDAVRACANSRSSEDQAILFDLLLELVASGDETAWLILGQPKLAPGDLAHLDEATAELVSDFTHRLHEELAIEVARPESSFTAAAVTTTLERLVSGMSDLGDTVNARADEIVEQLSSVQSDLRTAIVLEPGKGNLPPPVVAAITRAQVLDHDGAERLRRQLQVTSDPLAALTPLLARDPPAWWAGASGTTVVAAASFAAAHGDAMTASSLYEQAADLEGVDRGRCLALAGFYLADANRDRANELVARASQIDREALLVTTISALLDDDPPIALDKLGSTLHAEDDDALLMAGSSVGLSNGRIGWRTRSRSLAPSSRRCLTRRACTCTSPACSVSVPRPRAPHVRLTWQTP